MNTEIRALGAWENWGRRSFEGINRSDLDITYTNGLPYMTYTGVDIITTGCGRQNKLGGKDNMDMTLT